MIDERTYYVTVRTPGAPEALWRSPWQTREQAHETARRERERAREAGWNHAVQVFYRDGSEDTQEE